MGVSATFTVFLTHNGQQMYSKQITMSGDDYKNWGNDDNYVQQFVAKQLGFTIAPKPEPIVELLYTGPTGTVSYLPPTMIESTGPSSI